MSVSAHPGDPPLRDAMDTLLLARPDGPSATRIRDELAALYPGRKVASLATIRRWRRRHLRERAAMIEARR